MLNIRHVQAPRIICNSNLNLAKFSTSAIKLPNRQATKNRGKKKSYTLICQPHPSDTPPAPSLLPVRSISQQLQQLQMQREKMQEKREASLAVCDEQMPFNYGSMCAINYAFCYKSLQLKFYTLLTNNIYIACWN